MSSIGPGTVLGGRYRLDDLLTEHEGARFWRATDTVLARSVAVHAVPSNDPRAARLLEAARRSAMVTDPHLLRVLDCDDTPVGGAGDSSSITWVVNEWGSGVSLDLMLAKGTLPASRAAWLAREVAEAIAACHARGVPHGRLSPESVLVTEAGAVKLIGFVVESALTAEPPIDPLYGVVDDREADVINLAGILYAALTGRWPGISRSGVPAAPRVAHRPLRPRQVRAGIPRTLDAICDRVLNKEASQHVLPIETAHDIAAALSDYVGDPAAAAPLDVPSMYAEPTVTLNRDEVTGLPVLPTDDLGPKTATDPAPESTHESAPESALEPTQLVPVPEVSATEDTDEHPAVDPHATQASLPPTEDTSSQPLFLDRYQREDAEPAPPLPPFEQPPDRPLFASEERRPELAQPKHVRPPSGPDPITGSGKGGEQWPYQLGEDPDGQHFRGDEGRNWLRLAVIVGICIVVVAAMTLAFNIGFGSGGSDKTTSTKTTSTGTGAGQVSGQPLRIAGVHDFDPEATPPTENPADVPKAIDGDPATFWPTSTYRGNPKLGGLKTGVGLIIDLGSSQQVGSLEVDLLGSPTGLQIFATSPGVTSLPTGLDGLTSIGQNGSAGTTALFRFAKKPTTRFLVVWLTSLPKVSGGYRGEIAEVKVRS
ncbi:MAG: serine/threonine protein kinase [Marmoricola sp.]|nr:serine/threonine protein kinase [Marmoricola sp.]